MLGISNLWGIYGVISLAVARRSKEFGLRMALGLARLMATLLFGVQPTDPATFLSVSAILEIVALAASYIPAIRATKVDPMKALRCE